MENTINLNTSSKEESKKKHYFYYLGVTVPSMNDDIDFVYRNLNG